VKEKAGYNIYEENAGRKKRELQKLGR